MTRRLPTLVLIVALVVAGFVLDRGADRAAVVDAAAPVIGIPVATPDGAPASTWFCAGGTADEESFANHVVVMLNPTDRPVEATMVVHPGELAPPPPEPDLDDPAAEEPAADEEASDDESSEDEDADDAGDDEAADDAGDGTTEPAVPVSTEPVEQTYEIPARSRERVALRDLVQAPVASALVESDGGGLIVEHEVTSVHGLDSKPCATEASDTWHFAWGTTVREARQLLVLFNPFPEDAILDGRFSTEDGVREPARFDGLVVPARSTLAVDLGDDVTRRAEVAATITARTGRVVIDRIVRLDVDGGDRGLTLGLGVPEPKQAWVFPDGFHAEDVTETYVVYNPGDAVVEAEIAIELEDPDTNGIPAPIELSLAPGTHATVDIGADGRVPAGVAHHAVVRSANDQPLVAERVLASRRDGRRGLTVTTGSPVEATEWRFAVGSATDLTDQWLILVNLDPQVLAEVDVLAVADGQLLPVSELQGVVVEPGRRLAIRIGEKIQREGLPLIVRSTEPIVAERGLYRVGADRRGTSNAIGVPMPDGLRTPADPLELEVPDDLLDDAPVEEPGGDDVPAPPGDVDLPAPDETIVIDDPDAEAEVPGSSTSTSPGGSAPSSTEAPPG